MNTDPPVCLPCPFCGHVPVFSGEPEPRADHRYFVFRLPCECHDIEVCAGSWGDYKSGSGGSWPERSARLATLRWNLSFRTDSP